LIIFAPAACDQPPAGEDGESQQGSSLAVTPSAATSAAPATRISGDVVILLGPDGRPLLPDAERARRAGVQSLASNELAFTFNSPDDPWTAEELAEVQGWIDDCYPLGKTIYGPPAFAITVNLRKGPTSSGIAGTYSPSTNEITIGPSSIRADVVCHEMIHSFHDDLIIGMSTWEEGMTRATEIELMRRLGIPDPVDHHHEYAVHYQELNQPPVGGRFGSIFAGWGQTLMRYALAGYAWAKPMIEDDGFFVRFNAAYYAQAAGNPSLPSDEPGLIALVRAAKATIEDLPFDTWYARQYILDTTPPTGDFVYVRAGSINNVVLAVFSRDSSGAETNRSGVTAAWSITDDVGATVSTGSGVTNEAGVVFVPVPVPSGYPGRLQVSATATIGSATVSSSAYVKPDSTGIFGVVTGADTGSITFTPLDQAVAPVTVPVSRGGFDAPALGAVRGRVRYVFSGGSVTTAPAVLTKDGAPYFVHVRVGDTTATLAPGADAYTRDGGSASSNFGTETSLVVKQSSAGSNRVSYLKFPLSAVGGGVSKATLRLFGKRPTSSTIMDSVFSVPNNAWSETGITWNNRPALVARQSRLAIGTTSRYYEWDVTPFVAAQVAAGASDLSLAVTMDTATSNSPDTFNAREAGSNRPQLVVTFTP
jgi:hypothetical protein